MFNLKRFNKDKKIKYSIVLLILSTVLIIFVVLLRIYKTFAIYKIDKEYDLIVSKIGDFRGLNLITKYYINGIENSNIPTDKNYEVYVTCDNANGSWNYNNWKLNIEDATKYKVNCEIDFYEKYVLASANSTTSTIVANYSNIENISSNYYLYGTDKNNLNQKNNDITNLNSDTTYYFKKCYEYNNEEICSNVSSLLTGGKVTDFDYNGTTGADGSEQTYTTVCNGTYKMETWGAQGGDSLNGYLGGYGGYSTGKIKLSKNEIVYINVGGQGVNPTSKSCNIPGGYNGGGFSQSCEGSWSINNVRAASGGGATHIALQSGLLSSLENNLAKLLIVSGGGGGSDYSHFASNNYYYSNGGHGGGYVGGSSYNGISLWQIENNFVPVPGGGQSYVDSIEGGQANYSTKAKSGTFGKGADANFSTEAGAGGGFFGGGVGKNWSGSGGSGYIGNPLLTNKTMYCYECEESNEENTKTVSTTCSSSTPTQNCAKIGNGYVRITIEECSI